MKSTTLISRVKNKRPLKWVKMPPFISDINRQGPLSSDQLEAFNNNGFLVLRGVFSPDEIAAAHEQMNKQATSLGPHHPNIVTEPNDTKSVRTIFDIHRYPLFDRMMSNHRMALVTKQLIGHDIQIHHSRINLKRPNGAGFDPHQDGETWLMEDGVGQNALQQMVSGFIMLDPNTPDNGPLKVYPGSHQYFIPCIGQTPLNNYKTSLKKQTVGVPSKEDIQELESKFGSVYIEGKPGDVVFFSPLLVHESNDNRSSLCRSNLFFVYRNANIVLGEPLENIPIRPNNIANRYVEPITVTYEEAIVF